MLRSVILAAARSSRVAHAVETAPVSRNVVRRFVAGQRSADALRVTRELVGDGLKVTLDYLGEDTLTGDQAEHTRDEYVKLLGQLQEAELTPAAEVSVKLSALGQKFDEKLAEANARTICAAAAAAGTTVTLDMEDHETTDSTLEMLGRAPRRLSDDRRGAAGLPAADRGRLPRAGHRRASGCGCARGRTRSPSRWRTRRRSTSTSRTYAA